MNNKVDLSKYSSITMNRMGRVSAIFVISILLFMFVFFLVKKNLNDQLSEHITYNNAGWVSSIDSTLNRDITQLDVLQSIFSNNTPLNPTEYVNVLDSLNTRFTGVQNVYWAALDSNRVTPLYSWHKDNLLFSLDGREDLNSLYKNYIEKARDITSPVISDAIVFENNKKIILVFVPVYSEFINDQSTMMNKRERFKGIFIAQLDLDKYISKLNDASRFEDIDFILYDDKVQSGKNILLSKLTAYKEDPTDIIWNYSKKYLSSSMVFNVADRSWTMLALSTPKFEKEHTSFTIYFILIIGFIFSFGLAAIVAFLQDKFVTMTETFVDDKQKIISSEQRLRFNEGQLTEKNRFLATQKMKLEHKADLLQKNAYLRAEFLAVVAHKLRSPVNSIVVKSNVILDYLKKNLDRNVDKITKKEAVQLVEVIEKNSMNVLRFLNDALEISLVEANNAKLAHDAIVFRTYFEKMLASNKPEFDQKGLSLTLEIAKEVPPHMTADKRHLDRILKTILNNALRFTEKGSVAIRVFIPSAGFKYNNLDHAAKSMVGIEIKDTGVGMDAKSLDRLFKPLEGFVRSHVAGTSGLGLGLVLTREMIEIMGGEMNFTSEVGVGTTAIVFLPLS